MLGVVLRSNDIKFYGMNYIVVDEQRNNVAISGHFSSSVSPFQNVLFNFFGWCMLLGHCLSKFVNQDYVRTGTYYAAVIENRSDFHDRVIVDVGAGSGILSLFVAQAGTRHVYAMEASEMAKHARRLIVGNPSLGQRITIVKGKVEEVELLEKLDILISETMGTLLVNERMLESYVIARDRFLVPNGKIFPTIARIHLAPFSSEFFYVEITNKYLFWQQHNYYGDSGDETGGSCWFCSTWFFHQFFCAAAVALQKPVLPTVPLLKTVLMILRVVVAVTYGTQISIVVTPLQDVANSGRIGTTCGALEPKIILIFHIAAAIVVKIRAP
ncbi:probable histone-arginine methyltransferase 1.3 [Aristolochia californica]|uniref:probable histone-arginine methyltransferase 1.3 n=1 Tax=Aristolochia californica TaxID=171875 RepID=UPI0035DA5FD9